MATEGTGCGECGHAHHFDCPCLSEPPAPPPPPEPLPATREPGAILFIAGLACAIGGGWVLYNLRMVNRALGAVPVIMFVFPIMGAPKLLIMGGYMLKHRLPWGGLSSVPRRAAFWIAVACNVSVLLAGAFGVYALHVWYPEFRLSK